MKCVFPRFLLPTGSVWDPKTPGAARFAREYAFWNENLGNSGNDDVLYDDILSYLPRGASSALDLGCGPGRHTLWLAERVDKVVGIDISRSMIAMAKERQAEKGIKNVDFMVADVARLPFTGGAFDFVVSVHALQRADLNRVFSRLPLFVAPGGRVVITDMVTQRPRLDACSIWQVLAVLRKLPKYTMDYRPLTILRMLAFELSLKWIRYNCENVRCGYRMTQDLFETTYQRLLPECTFKRHRWRSVVFWEAPRQG